MIQPDDRSPDLSVDHSELLTRVDNDRELLHELLGIFKKEFPCILQSLQEAVVRGDMKKVEVTAHTIKGMLTNVFFARAAASAMRLECIGRQRNTDGLQEELASFEPRAEALALAELEAFCRETIR
jgi:HPt (histidine-containing phosphotransfer) domain-containing protein